MKQSILLMAAILIGGLVLINACTQKGQVTPYLVGTENLPDDLKGLKVYSVGVSEGTSVFVAVLDGKVNSVTTQGKHPQTTIMVDASKEKIIYETDSLILLKK
jgi:hypothetical protein